MRRGRDERGAAAIEMVLVAPALLLLVAVILGSGRFFSALSALDAVAREAGRSAVEAPDARGAVTLGRQAAMSAASAYGLAPGDLSVEVDPGSFARGGQVRVVATYRVRLAELPLIGAGIPAVTLRAVHLEPIDPYKSR
jgi:Flp pilus assembly protein TadG